jgi:hypothetical protein
MTSIARLDRVLRHEARLPSKLLLLHSCEDDSASVLPSAFPPCLLYALMFLLFECGLNRVNLVL